MYVHGFSEILRNVTACRKIRSIFIGSKHVNGLGHAFNQVNIGGKWYYVDLTFDSETIKKGGFLWHCLLSKQEFEDINDHIAADNQKTYESMESYYVKDENGNNDFKATLYYIKELADKGIVEAQYFLGYHYFIGKEAIQDDNKALKYFMLAAEQGNLGAQNILKRIKEDQGINVAGALEEALKGEPTSTEISQAKAEMKENESPQPYQKG